MGAKSISCSWFISSECVRKMSECKKRKRRKMSGREKSGDKMQQDAARRDKMRFSEETFFRGVDFEKLII